MEIVNVRIDERLIHGQVAALWTNKLGITRIVVVNNEIIKDQIQKMALKMATPVGVKLSILSVDTAVNNLKINKYEKDKILLITKGPKEIFEVISKGIDIKEINVGNMSAKAGSKLVKSSISVRKEDIEYFNKISQLGVRITAQMVPTEEKINFMNLIK
ncbi:PTS sugar transporter subunit IIB [Clostridium sp. CTA-7]